MRNHERNPNDERRPKLEAARRVSSFGFVSVFVIRHSSLFVLLSLFAAVSVDGAPTDSVFQQGITAYRGNDYLRAAKVFQDCAAAAPSAGAFQNLGIAEWQQGHTGFAILAWERALWLEPFNQAVRGNLRFARRAAQVQSPDLTWYEVVSSWLPLNSWAWIAGVSLWLAVAMITLPDILRRPRAVWHQAVAALCLMVFLLSLPAHLGVYTRSRLGYIVQKETPLRLTPTHDAQSVGRLAAGEPARWERARGNFVLIRTTEGHRGWIEREQLGLIF